MKPSERLVRAALSVGDLTYFNGRYLFTPKGKFATDRGFSRLAVARLVASGEAKRIGNLVVRA